MPQFGKGEAFAGEGVDDCEDVAEFVVEIRALNALRQGRGDVADFLAHLVPQSGHLGRRGVVAQ
jgi:hypothetical protein